MARALFDYDPASGKITDAKGLIAFLAAATPFPAEEGVPVDALVKLKEAGFSAEEIIELHRKGVLRHGPL